jgi:hypothetical protein
VGRVTASSSNTVSVFVDDNALAVATTSTLAGNTNRTWYDGISYSRVEPFRITNVLKNPNGSVTLTWNSIPANSSLMAPTYTVLRKTALTDPAWTAMATGIPSAGASTTYTDNAPGGAAYYWVKQ